MVLLFGVAGHWLGLAPWGDLRTTTTTNLGERPPTYACNAANLLCVQTERPKLLSKLTVAKHKPQKTTQQKSDKTTNTQNQKQTTRKHNQGEQTITKHKRQQHNKTQHNKIKNK